MIELIPPLIAGCCLLIYWGTVLRKAIQFARREKHDANFIPRERTGRWIRVLWFPVIVAWSVQPWLLVFGRMHARHADAVWLAVGVSGAMVSLVATVATFACWREMGKSWRIGIDPTEKTKLVFTGPYRFVRHPIYALGTLLAAGTLATTPTVPMLVLTVAHACLLQLEARREESYLLGKHGEAYADYRRRVGGFIPGGALMK
jgi:protein-S-isoprenylcysteine O-methyltransferase Ste14